eukprot:CAMPEP_0113628420 /NCGR_PEP_ID=MMETSP0017_2-20120614/14725_1 /TAXON_ID=2856 /ORGANISM="Cylindrotheca closterium" /LENGTH=80 /DNA_ID=CAMNT_0000538723 /DNA_START=118 /DNA_END=357 /DNA_ORIENTATION=- /assembly_acc=CAM_ASM_000147
MTIKEDVTKKPAPSSEYMDDRREEATITTEITESTTTSTIHNNERIIPRDKLGRPIKKNKPGVLSTPLTANQDRCCESCW